MDSHSFYFLKVINYFTCSIIVYGIEVCPTNAADLQSMQFTINRVIIKLFGTMSQNYYQVVSNYFGISTVKELIHNRFEKLRISYGAADNYLWRLIFVRCWTYSDCIVYILICPIAIAYSMGQIIKSFCVCKCVCACVCPSVDTVTVAFLRRFSPNWTQTCKPPKVRTSSLGVNIALPLPLFSP